MTDKAQPSPAEMEKMQAVSEAGAEAAVQAPPEQRQEDVRKAMRRKADEVKLELSDEQLNTIADMFVTRFVDEIDRRGAFEPPPEPVQPPEQAQQAPTPPPDQPAAGEPAPKPQRRSLAARFMGQ